MTAAYYLFHLVFLVSPLPLYSSSKILVWPKPTSLSWPHPNPTTLLSPSFLIHHPPHNPVLRSATRRYLRLLLSERHHPLFPTYPPPSPSTSPLLSLNISVSNLSTSLHPSADESYSLGISGPTAVLHANTTWGAIRGLETFSQLALGRNGEEATGLVVVVPAELDVFDRPKFGHRGLLLDTSRNFYPVEDILRTIEAMAANKMNVFHWHLTDSHSFPIVLPSEPELAQKGSYGPRMRYSPEDVRRIVRFAMRRGVRVVPEFDAPGHTASWAEAYPDIITCADRFWSPPDAEPLAAEPGTGQLNPLLPKTYDVYFNVLNDAAKMFPDSFLHAGADEVSPGCWKTDPTIQSFLSNNGTLSQILELFINTTHPYIDNNLHRTTIYWEDVLLDPVIKVDSSLLPPKTTILQTWKNGPNNTKRIVSAGYRVIVSSSDFYYLDCGHGGFVGNDSRYDQQVGYDKFNHGGSGGSWCAPFKTWQRIYDYDITYGLEEEEAELVLGGEVALWSEQADPTVLDARVWPRASAMAEALWSGNRDETGKKRYAEATNRLNEWRYRMVGRGVRAEPIQPLWCVYHPGMCNFVQ